MRSAGDIQFFVCRSRIIPEPPFPSQGIAGSGNEIDRLWSEAQNILRQHMHKKEFGIMTMEHGNKLKRENEAEGHGPSASVSYLSLFPHLLVKIQNSFLCIHSTCI